MATKLALGGITLLGVLVAAPAVLAERPSTPITVELNISHAPKLNEWARVTVRIKSLYDAPSTQVEILAPKGIVEPAGIQTVDLKAYSTVVLKGRVRFLETGNREVLVRARKAQPTGAVWGDAREIPVFVGGGRLGRSKLHWKVTHVPVAKQAKIGDAQISSTQPVPFSFADEARRNLRRQDIPAARLPQGPSHPSALPENPGDVTLTGGWVYADRNGVSRNAAYQLLEIRKGDGTALDSAVFCYTGSSGSFSCTFPHPGTTMRVWLRSWTELERTGGSDRLGVVSGPEVTDGCGSYTVGCSYAVQTGEISCADGSSCNVGTWAVTSSVGEPWLGATQIVQDLIRSWTKLYQDDTYGPGVSAGPARVNYPVPYGHGTHAHVGGTDGIISIEPPNQGSGDSVAHEYGHVVMSNLWSGFTPNWPTSDCPSPHYINGVSGPGCALSEGFANFWAWYSNEFYDGDNSTSNDGPVFDWASGASTNMETRDNGTYPSGDEVEGNVAAALGDLFDIENETPSSGPVDDVSDGIQHIWNTLSTQSAYDFAGWWDGYLSLGHQECPALDALWLNTIEYGDGCTAPTVAITISPPSLMFGAQEISTPSSSQAVTLTNTGESDVTFSSIAVVGGNTGDFGQSNDCSSPLAAGGTCTINVTFTPTAAGLRKGSVVVTSDASGSPQRIILTGLGTE